LDDGGLERMESWLQGHPETRLIIVDTFPRVKPMEKKMGSLTAQDYASIAPITDLAHDYHVTIELVMHVRKAASEDNDPMDLVSGTHGLSGAADGTIVMKRARDSNDALLYVIDRDHETRELAISWDIGNGGWFLRGDAADYKRSIERNAILEALYAGGPATPRELADRLGKPSPGVKSLLWKMLQDRQVANMGGSYMPLAPRPIAPMR
ncbi:MAG TPA: hypothetical protein VNM48_02615, partial [Chloroflexota bacterium]|nr:hypothetical protein [Chloroflexota bacterium]